MDYQINTMDYWSLVNMLMTQITPQTRKQILERLIEMNNQLMVEMNPLPLDMPIGLNNQFNQRRQTSSAAIKKSSHQSPKNNILTDSDEIDLDDIISEIRSEPDVLDKKLAKIKNLQNKIVTDRQRLKKSRKKS